MMAAIAEVLALSGESEQAMKIATDFNLLSLDPPISKFRQALLALAFGQTERALSLLAASQQDREAELVWINVDPRLDLIRQLPTFKTIVHEVFPTVLS